MAILKQDTTIGGVEILKSLTRDSKFVIGTSLAGYTTADCDYLCDGKDDQVEINQAIQAISAGGGVYIS